MKYSCEILIDQPREKVTALFGNPENMKFWQKGFISLTPVSGELGKTGAKSKLKYEFGKRNLEMTETIVENGLPAEFHATFETKGVFNNQKNYFKVEGEKTRWISEAEFKCSGFMKVIAFLWGSKTFKKQSEVYMGDFKSFAEGAPKYGN